MKGAINLFNAWVFDKWKLKGFHSLKVHIYSLDHIYSSHFTSCTLARLRLSGKPCWYEGGLWGSYWSDCRRSGPAAIHVITNKGNEGVQTLKKKCVWLKHCGFLTFTTTRSLMWWWFAMFECSIKSVDVGARYKLVYWFTSQSHSFSYVRS